jgi:hypothetical protein
MATGYSAQVTAAQDPAFLIRVRGAIVKAAEDIYSEAGTVPGHAARAALATAIAREPDGYAVACHGQAFALAIAVTGVDNTSTDAAIYSAVASIWNLHAGA